MKEKILLYLKGVAMGSADVVPGVSGGTIAFISGIYDTLLSSIQAIDFVAFKLLLSFRLKDFWQKINGNFLVILFAGIATSILSLAKIVTWLIEHQPVFIWSFFFGLVVASAVTVALKIKSWNVLVVLFGTIGIAIAYYVTVATPAETPESLWFIFICGAVAICAMILPGISGSFILLLMKKYHFIMASLTSFKLSVIITFGLGCVAGLLSFSRILKFLLRKYHDATIALLTGFMVGSLNAVWPWKQVTQTYTDRHGVVKPLIQTNVSPFEYTQITGLPNELVVACILAVIGVIVVLFIEKFSATEK
jgi:putative membrane protein